MRYKYDTIERSLNYSEQFNFKGKVINSVTKTPISGARIITPSPLRTDIKFHSLQYAGSNNKNDSYTKTDGSFTAKGAVGQVITFTHPDYFPASFKYKGKYNNTIELTPLLVKKILPRPILLNLNSKVLDAVSNIPLEGVYIRILQRVPLSGTLTNSVGVYKLDAYSNEKLEFSHKDYKTITIDAATLAANQLVRLQLKTARIDETLVTDPYIKTEQLDEVIVTANSKKINYKMIGFGLLGLIILKKIFSKKTKKVKL